jgi:hypothetical protein
MTKHSHGGPIGNWNSIANYLRARAIKLSYWGLNSVSAQERAAEGVNFRYYFQEPIKYGADLPDILNFDGDFTWKL